MAKLSIAPLALLLLVGGAPQTANVESTLEIIDVATGARQVVYRATTSRPRTGRATANSCSTGGGRIYRMPAAGGRRALDTGVGGPLQQRPRHLAGRQAAGDQRSPRSGSSLHLCPAAIGGAPRRSPRWRRPTGTAGRPTAQTLAYCAERDGEYDIYTDPAQGGPETRLTTAPGLDDGPDYSPDGRFIYFNSERSGLMQIWRMKADGTGQEQVTDDDYNNWFPHPSPDGSGWSFFPTTRTSRDTAENQDVMLRLMPPAAARAPEVIVQAVRRPGHDQRAVVVAGQPRSPSSAIGW